MISLEIDMRGIVSLTSNPEEFGSLTGVVHREELAPSAMDAE
jgi:hypothetical protein